MLRTFEAAARHRSFARAAAELHVTPAAVSQQMRLLEQRLGIALFLRGARGLTVTAEGRDYALRIAGALAEIEQATRALGRSDRVGTISIASFPSFATFWLLPRLDDFRTRYPEIDVRMSLGLDLVSLADGATDVAIRFGHGDYRDGVSRRLMGDAAVAVASPALIAGRAPPRNAGELAGLPLLIDDGLIRDERSLQWSEWLGDSRARHRAIHLPDGMMTLQAAMMGQGVALTRRSLVSDHFRSGRLVQLLAEERATTLSYWVVTPEGPTPPRVGAFVEWLFERASPEAG